MTRQLINKSPFALNFRWIGLVSVGTGILIHLPEIAILLGQHDTHDHYHPHWVLLNTPLDILIGIAGSVLSTFLLFCFYVQFFKQAKYNVPNVILTFVLSFIFTTILSKVFSMLQFSLTGSEMLINELKFLHPLQNLAITTIVFLFCRIYYITHQRQQLKLELRELETENIQSQYQALRNQVNPHFLFNSLNTLNALIREDPKTAQLYVRELSTVLRSTLQNNTSDTITLAEELHEVDSYLFLLKMRYEDNLFIEKQIEEKYLSMRILPLALQHLVENAVKHNIISKQKPLRIKIYTTEDEGLIVSNSLQPKMDVLPNTGTGLANLSRRYILVADEEIRIEYDDKEFTVELPLLEKEEKEKTE